MDVGRTRDQIRVPAFQAGGLVKETGLALVHKDEYIVPAPGSAAAIEPAELTGQTVINYYFPIEIVVVGALSHADHQEIQARVWERLSDALDRIT